jgi:hypothetical protein
MADTVTQNDQPLADQLAAACGAADLCAAAAIDAEEGDRFLHARLADQMAGAHLLTMRMAALADRAINAAAEGAGQNSANLPLFDLAAARFAGAAARLNGRYCRSLQTLRGLAGTPDDNEEDVEWVGIPRMAAQYLTPEERTRRINREKFYCSFMRPIDEPDGETGRAKITAAERARLAAADRAARSLLRDTGVDTLAGTSNSQRRKLFAHQLAVAHRLVMRLTGRADSVIAESADALDRPESLRLAYGAARLMERFRQGVAMLQRTSTGPDRPRRIRSYYGGVIRDDEAEAQRAEDIANGLDPDTCLPADLVRRSPKGEGGSPQGEACRSLGEGRRGRLNNGNPGGDFLAAPRCGARTRAGCACRQPAMANGRCRFHGGKSTGARTAEGLARVRSARLVHGLRSAEVIAISAAAAAAHRSLGLLLAAARRKPETRMQKSEGHAVPSAGRLLASDFCLPASVPAGHGVDRSESSIAAGDAVVLPFARPAPHAARPPCAPLGRVKCARSPRRNRIPRVGS